MLASATSASLSAFSAASCTAASKSASVMRGPLLSSRAAHACALEIGIRCSYGDLATLLPAIVMQPLLETSQDSSSLWMHGPTVEYAHVFLEDTFVTLFSEIDLVE